MVAVQTRAELEKLLRDEFKSNETRHLNMMGDIRPELKMWMLKVVNQWTIDFLLMVYDFKPTRAELEWMCSIHLTNISMKFADKAEPCCGGCKLSFVIDCVDIALTKLDNFYELSHVTASELRSTLKH